MPLAGAARCVPIVAPMPRFRLPYAAATVAYCAFIFYLSAQSDPPKPDIGFDIPGLDKLAHAVLFGCLAGVVSIGLRRSNASIAPKFQFYAPIAFAVLYGVTDEIHQVFVPERTFELLDLVADAAGAFGLQLVLCGIVWKRWPHR